MRLAEQILIVFETATTPAKAVEIGRAALAIMAVERMLRALYTPPRKTKSKPVN
ncbi:hypothetical protein [Asticcacaulis excentricus]|nr:hypothetical protein [Asticcacaulis excentricus]